MLAIQCLPFNVDEILSFSVQAYVPDSDGSGGVARRDGCRRYTSLIARDASLRAAA